MVTFTDVATSQALIASVTSDAASVTAITEAAPAPVEGSTFTLTTGTTDALFGTAGNDTFTGSSTTLQDTDIIADSSSDDSDVLNVSLTDDIDLTAATIVGIEEVNFNLDAFTTTTGTTLSVDLNGVASSNVAFDVVKAGSRVTDLNLDEVRSGTVTLSNEFATATITGNNNANLDIVSNVTGTNVFSLTEDGATTANLNVTSGGGLTLTNVDADGAVTLTAGDNITVTDADPATSLTATSSAGWIEVTTADGATTLNLTAAEDVDVVGATSATTVTISGKGTAADTTLAADQRASTITATAATTLNASGNGGAIDVNAVGSTALKTINVTGDEDVNIFLDASAIDGLTSDKLYATDSGAGTSKVTLNTAAGNVNTTEASEIDVFDLAIDNTGKTMTVSSGETVQISVDQANAASTFTSALSTAAVNELNLIIDDNLTATNTITLTADVITNIKDVNITLNDNLATATSFNAGTAANVTVTGSKTLTLAGSTTANQIDASAMTGVVTANLAGVGTVGTISTGSAADTITMSAARTSGNFTINTGAGADTINAIDAGAVIDGGDGDDTVAFSTSVDLSGQTFGLTSVEVIDIDSTSIATATFADNANNDNYTLAGTVSAGDTFAVTNDAGNTFTYTAVAGDAVADVAAGLAALDASIAQVGNTAVITVTDGAGNNAASANADSSVAITSATTLTIDGTQLTGKETSVTSSNAASATDDSLVVTVTDGTTDLNGVVVDASTVATTINANAYTAIVAATVKGTNDNDTITGNGGKSFTAYGFTGDDTITGGATADNLFGEAGADTLNGANGNDLLDGGAGNDTLNGDAGADTLTGGSGDDNFNYGAGESTATSMDTITDYQGAAAASDNDTITIAGTTAVVANVAATDDVSAHAADAAGVLTANQIEIVVTSGILSLAGDADKVAVIDTLDEWIDVALLAFENGDTTGGAAANQTDTLAFVFGGDTYVVSSIDTLNANDTMAVDNIIKLQGVTDLTALATTAAANTILVA
jgi:Ca2+-binding RTX toxin-like protein